MTNWMGNVIMPTVAGLFFAFAVVRYARGENGWTNGIVANNRWRGEGDGERFVALKEGIINDGGGASGIRGCVAGSRSE